MRHIAGLAGRFESRYAGQDVPEIKLTRKEAKERTRQRLIDAVLHHIRENGMSGLTTGRVAEAAGIAQSSFYVHFKDMDEALQAAAEKLGVEMRGLLTEQRQRVDLARSPNANLRVAYEGTLRALLAYPALTDLMLSHRRDRNSPLGECLRAIIAEAREDLISDVRHIFGDAATDFDLEAHFIVGLTLTTVEGVVDGRLESVEGSLDHLVQMTLALAQQKLMNA